MSRILEVYLDTSVFGGCFDEKFAVDSRRVFDLARLGHLRMIVSDIVLAELAPAPLQVRDVMQRLPNEAISIRPIDQEVIRFREAYMTAGILTGRWIDDATHVAIASIA